MNIDKKNINTWSLIGQRATLGLALYEIVKDHPDLMVCTSDVSTSAGLDRFRKTYKDNYVEVGIAEQNLIGIATGLASENFKVITTTFSPFQVLRCCEQIKVNLGYMKYKIIMIGLASGLSLGSLGFTHASIEDIGVLRSIPNISIVSPADGLELVKTLRESLNYKESLYIRLTGSSKNPIINHDDYDFKIGKAVKIFDGKKIALICNGPLVYNCIKVRENLEAIGLNPMVINMHTVKPIDKSILKEISEKCEFIFTAEEHNIIGGLGSAVAEVMSEIGSCSKLIRLGINDKYPKGGDQKYLQEINGLSTEKIIDTITGLNIKA